MDLIGDITSPIVWVQAGILLFLIFVLKTLIFDPYLRLYETRQERLSRGTEGVDAMMGEVEEMSAKVEAALRDARNEAQRERNAIREKAQSAEKAAVSAAREEALAKVDKARGEVEKEMKQARTQLETDARTLAFELAGKLLGRQVS